MKTKPYLVVYNIKSNSVFECDNLESFEILYFDNKKFDKVLCEAVQNKTTEKRELIVINSKVCLSPFWQQRLLAVLQDKQVQLCSALSCKVAELSPLADGDVFNGSVKQLDNLIYLMQSANTFFTDSINPECFIVSDKSVLSNLDNTPFVACNNLLVQANKKNKLKLTDINDLGNQKPLPAHPLANLQWRLKLNLNFKDKANYPLLDKKPIMLHINMGWGGGVYQWINDYCKHENSYHHIILSSDGELYRQRHGESLTLIHHQTNGVELRKFELQAPIKATCISHPEYKQILDKIIAEFQVQQIMVSSLIGHSMECLQTGIATTKVLHDYFPSWPSLIAHLDSDEITDKDLDQALKQTKNEPFGKISKQKYLAWKNNIHKTYKSKLVNLVAPSRSVVDNLSKIDASTFSDVTVIPHAISKFDPIKYSNQKKIFQILVLGRINHPKGQDLLEEIVEKLGNDYCFVFIGAGNEGKKYLSIKNITVIMEYTNAELEMLLQETEPDLALITSQTSETFNYTLSELQQAGICTVSTKYGALRNRIIDGETGFLCDDNAEDMVNLIRGLRHNPDKIIHVRSSLQQYKLPSFKNIITQYKQLFSNTKKSKYLLLESKPGNNIFAKNLISLDKEKKRINNLLQETESSLDERTKWAKKLTKQLKKAEKNIFLEREESSYLKQTFKQEQKTQKDLLNKERKASKHEMSRLNIEIDDLRTSVINIQAQYEETNNLLQITQNSKEVVEQELQLVYQSRSWRITKPVRSFTTWARHKRNAVKFRFAQLKTLPSRVVRSLKSRGVAGTIEVAKGKIEKPKKIDQPVVELTTNYKTIEFTSAVNPTVSIIIPVYNHFEHTYNCLKSIFELSDNASFEIIVVDDCSTDDTETLIKNITGITYQRQQQNGGFIESCNTGAKLAKGQYLMFLNNDTVVYANWLDALVTVFNNYPNAGLVGSKLVYPNNQLQEAGGIIFADASGWNYGRLGNPEEPWYNHIREVDYCSGASILIENKLFKELGCFDRSYKPAYYEDVDLAFKIRETGKKVYYQPASKITHFEGISSGTDLTQGMKKYQVVNQTKFKEKWAKQLKQQPQAGFDIEISRFQNKQKRVLIFDACTPTPDQDAGSLRMINIIKILKESNYHVVFMPENLSFVEKYTQDLQQMMVECIYVPAITNPIKYLQEKGKYFNHVIMSRHYVAEPVMPFIREYCPNAKIIFDTVDLHYLREQRMAEVTQDARLIKAADVTKNKELAIIKQCDTTLVVSPFEVEVLKSELPNADIQILSTIHAIYGCRKSYQHRKDIMFIGSYQHTPNVDAVTWFVESVFPLIEKEIPKVVFHIIGPKAPKHIKQMARGNIKFHGFVGDIEPFMDDIRIAVAPLRYGAGVKGKINSSMSYGQPVVGTACAVEGMFTQEGKDVLTADTAEKFAKQVIRLYQDERLWNTISKGGLENVQNYFSFAAAKKAIQQLLEY